MLAHWGILDDCQGMQAPQGTTKTVYLVQEVQDNRNTLAVDAHGTSKIADQLCSRHIHFGEAPIFATNSRVDPIGFYPTT